MTLRVGNKGKIDSGGTERLYVQRCLRRHFSSYANLLAYAQSSGDAPYSSSGRAKFDVLVMRLSGDLRPIFPAGSRANC
jgi:hypothetical protein